MLKAWRGVLYTVRPSVGGMSYAGAAQDRSREPACRAAQSVSDASCPSCPVRLAWRRRAVSSGPEVLVGPRGTAAETRGHGRPISIKGGGGGGYGAASGPYSSALGGVRFAEKKFFAVQWRCGGLRRWGAPREPAQGFRGSAGGLPSVGRVHAVRRAAAAPAGAVALAEGRDDDAVAVVGGPLGLDIGLHRQSAVSYRQRARS